MKYLFCILVGTSYFVLYHVSKDIKTLSRIKKCLTIEKDYETAHNMLKKIRYLKARGMINCVIGLILSGIAFMVSSFIRLNHAN